VASDLTFRDDPNLVIPSVIAGVQNALKAAASTPTVKRFVLTSSSNALVVATPNTKYHLDQNSWNEVSPKEAWKTEGYDPATRPLHVYSASKVEGERAAWEFMETEKPHFVLNTVCPNFNTGEILDKRQRGSSAGYIKALWEGDPQITGLLQNSPPQFVIDVKDDAKLHVAGLTMVDVKGERLLALSEPFNYSRWCESLKKIDPSKNFPPPPENEGKNISTVDMERSMELLKRMGVAGLTPLDESVKQLIASVS
jgi:nucleoside-diphosphate-sugar epimerase